MLIGEYEVRVTDKNRLSLPKKLREELNGKIYITRGYENCLIVLDEKRWDGLISQIERKPFLNKTVRDTKRFIAGGANQISIDSQGRFLIAQQQKEYANIQSEVMFVGILDWIEIWAKSEWEKKVDDLSQYAGEIAEKLID